MFRDPYTAGTLAAIAAGLLFAWWDNQRGTEP